MDRLFRGLRRSIVLISALSAAGSHAMDAEVQGSWFTFTQSQGDERIEQRVVATDTAVALLDASGARVALYRMQADELVTMGETGQPASRITRAAADTLAASLRQQLDRLQEELADMSPEQAELTRLRMRQLFSRGQEKAFPQPDSIVSTGETGEQAGIPCTMHQMLAADAVIGRACLADVSAVDHASTLVSMLSLVSHFHTTLRQVDPTYIDMVMPGTPLLSLPEGSGIPVLVELFSDDGAVLRTLELTEAWSDRVPASLTELPPQMEIVDVATHPAEN
jgi:hypothetical protein